MVFTPAMLSSHTGVAHPAMVSNWTTMFASLHAAAPACHDAHARFVSDMHEQTASLCAGINTSALCTEALAVAIPGYVDEELCCVEQAPPKNELLQQLFASTCPLFSDVLEI